MRPNRLVLDTSAYSWLRSGHPEVRAWFRAAKAVYLPIIVIGELHAGFRLGSRVAENRRALEELLSLAYVHVREVTESVADHYGSVFAELRRQGTPIPTNDLWIAATTLDTGGHLLTFDKHFSRVSGLPHTVLSASAQGGQ